MFRTRAGVTPISVRTHTRAVSDETSPMPNDPHTLGVLIITTGIGMAMTWVAARLSLIELRKPQRCPACGRQRIAGVCGCGA